MADDWKDFLKEVHDQNNAAIEETKWRNKVYDENEGCGKDYCELKEDIQRYG